MLAFLVIASHLCIAYVYASSSAGQLLVYACMWLLGVACAARLWQHYIEAGQGKKVENTQRWYVNWLI